LIEPEEAGCAGYPARALNALSYPTTDAGCPYGSPFSYRFGTKVSTVFSLSK
jgi:hypothetical protein